ncbi:UPF0481 protein At3g47200-like [Lolium perenne]|uniref:UPF0481 protein At3g47200-like n=1 Tax=Lolium perenne TaxID=4522 RepID=UPI003A991CB5
MINHSSFVRQIGKTHLTIISLADIPDPEAMAPRVGSRALCVDIDKMVFSMTNKMDSYWLQVDAADKDTRLCQICRVPEHIREVGHVSYEPIVLSIGPYHHGAQHLQAMEKEKWQYVDHILKLNREIDLTDHLRAISKLEKLTRTCYSAEIGMTRKCFMKMLFLDSCFILITIYENIHMELHRNETLDTSTQETHEAIFDAGEENGTMQREHGYAQNMLLVEEEISEVKSNQAEFMNDSRKVEKDYKNTDDCNKVGDWYSHFTWRDIFLLENQIPFFIIEKIYEVSVGKRVGIASLADKACICVEDFLYHYPIAIQEPDRPNHFHHLLHLCHTYLRPSQRPCDASESQSKPWYFRHLVNLGQKYFRIGQKQEENMQNRDPVQQLDCFLAGELPVRWRRATQYHEAGVVIKKREWSKYNRHSLLDIKFSNGVVEIPCFPIDENTEPLFKNLIAFEQTDHRFGNDIASFVLFMSEFVSTPADATLFTNNGIIVHMLDSDDELSALFNRLSKQMCFTFDGYHYLKSMCHLLELHYQSRLNRWIAWLWFNHFSNPWLALAFFAAVIVLVCTVVQTIYTVLAYVKPSS